MKGGRGGEVRGPSSSYASRCQDTELATLIIFISFQETATISNAILVCSLQLNSLKSKPGGYSTDVLQQGLMGWGGQKV